MAISKAVSLYTYWEYINTKNYLAHLSHLAKKFQTMPLTAWIKKHSFSLWAFMIWLILCVPQNVVTLVMYYHQDFQDSLQDTGNYTCYEFHTFNDWDIVQLKGIIIVVVACFGIIGNLFSILVLQRLSSKSGFNKLLLALGALLVYTIIYPHYWLCNWSSLGLISWKHLSGKKNIFANLFCFQLSWTWYFLSCWSLVMVFAMEFLFMEGLDG